MNVISIHVEVPAATPITAPIRVEVQLPGKYITGVSLDSVLHNDVAMRITEGRGAAGGRLFPAPNAQAVIMNGPAPGNLPTWYWSPLAAPLMPVRIVSPKEEVTVEFINLSGATASWSKAVLIVASAMPDEMALQLMREIKLGLDRYPVKVAEALEGLIKASIERQGVPR